MADYGARTGGSLRDALNQAYPLTGLGEYSSGYPPNAGGPQPEAGLSRPPLPGAPVPQQGLTQPPLPGGPQPQPGLSRPPLPGGPAAPQPGLSRPPLPAGLSGIPPEVLQSAMQGDPRALAMIGQTAQQQGQQGQGPPNYAAQLGLTGQ